MERRSRRQRFLYAVGRVPEPVWAPGVSFTLLAIIGGFALAAGQPWIFPSLGPTAYLQTATPGLPTARMYNVLMGHYWGIASGYAAAYLLGANDAPAVLSTYHVTTVRAFAASLAVMLTMLFGIMLKAQHPPAAATTLIVALGGFKGWHGVAALAAGIAILGVMGEAVRRLRAEGNKTFAAETLKSGPPTGPTEAPPLISG
jgi:hypothetical protein